MATNERDFLERLERSRMQDVRRVAGSTPRRVERERDIFDRIEDFLSSKEGVALSLTPQASIPVGLAETAVGVHKRSLPQTGLGLLSLIPFVGSTRKAAALKKASDVAQEAAHRNRSFQTAMGSTYEITPTGTTIRNKARRQAHGDDYGIQPESMETFYVDPYNLDRLAVIQARGPRTRIVQIGPDWYGVQFLEGPYAGKVSQHSTAIVTREPKVGLTPVELFASPARVRDPVLPRQGSSGVHFGNTITKVGNY